MFLNITALILSIICAIFYLVIFLDGKFNEYTIQANMLSQETMTFFTIVLTIISLLININVILGRSLIIIIFKSCYAICSLYRAMQCFMNFKNDQYDPIHVNIFELVMFLYPVYENLKFLLF